MTLLNDIDVGGTKYKYANSIPMGTCATPAGSEVKECAFADSFELAVGNLISVTFTYANTYGDGSTTYPKLLINGTQYPVKQPVGGYASSGAWANGQAVTFMFDGTNLVFLTVPVVDTVAANNMNSVSSNAVAGALTTPQNGTITSDYDYYFNTVTKIGNIINLRLELYNGSETIAANTTKFMGNIPAGFRPNNRLGIEVGNCNASNGRLIEMWHCDIGTTGDIILYTGNSDLDFAYINAMYIV